MRKRPLLFVLLAIAGATTALPAAASAAPWHTHITGNFNIHGGTAVWSSSGGQTFACNTVIGSGNYTTTTGGTVTLTIGTCRVETIFGPTHCGIPQGNIITTTLSLDNVMLGAGKPGVLLTPNTATGGFAHFNCGYLAISSPEGSGLLGTVVSPACGTNSTTATWDFNAGAHGAQQHTSYTGSTYSWTNGAKNIALDMEATVFFPTTRSMTCT